MSKSHKRSENYKTCRNCSKCSKANGVYSCSDKMRSAWMPGKHFTSASCKNFAKK